MHISITNKAIDPWTSIADYEAEQTKLTGKHGANVVFLGRMRDFNESDDVQQMELEHYPGMTEKYLKDIVEQAMTKWDIMDVLVMHRVGVLRPADTIVVVATWAAHRAHAYAANQFIMEVLKSTAPFWKKETLSNGKTRWVEKNTPGQV